MFGCVFGLRKHALLQPASHIFYRIQMEKVARPICQNIRKVLVNIQVKSSQNCIRASSILHRFISAYKLIDMMEAFGKHWEDISSHNILH